MPGADNPTRPLPVEADEPTHPPSSGSSSASSYIIRPPSTERLQAELPLRIIDVFFGSTTCFDDAAFDAFQSVIRAAGWPEDATAEHIPNVVSSSTSSITSRLIDELTWTGPRQFERLLNSNRLP